MYSFWYQKKFGGQLEELKRLREHANTESLSKIDETIKIIDLLIANEKPVPPSKLEDKLDEEAKVLDIFAPVWHIVDPLAGQREIFLKPRYNPIPKLSDDEMLGLVHDFFKDSCDRELFKLFRGIFKKRRKFIDMHYLQDNDFEADATFLPYYRQVYIRQKRRKTIADLSALSHEFGHGIHFLTNYDFITFVGNPPFSEVVSTFFEILSLDYFRRLREFEKASRTLEINNFNFLIENSKDFIIETELLHIWKKQKEEKVPRPLKILSNELSRLLKERYKEEYGEEYCGEDDEYYDEDDLDYMLSYTFTDNFQYCASYVIAVELFELYRKDRDFGLYMLKEFMAIPEKLPIEQYYIRLLDLGIHVGGSLEEYKNHIIRPTNGDKTHY